VVDLRENRPFPSTQSYALFAGSCEHTSGQCGKKQDWTREDSSV